ncbi:hypothetical protein BV22DRAFT_435235 [Leucogyrophana mollusca]|uniref:Uncharacterized protein n=1 Tax=Leucogyrophana mollusca TaxID=85980 RepID=A0ACB8BJI5_9AGAM|nr:hypothetical protein BV22DRAFT_435235 [Leucogyrophana mollusca]
MGVISLICVVRLCFSRPKQGPIPQRFDVTRGWRCKELCYLDLFQLPQPAIGFEVSFWIIISSKETLVQCRTMMAAM